MYVSSCAAIDPVSVYGWSKHFAEMFVRCFHSHSVIVRPFNIWGDESEYKDPSIVQKILTGKLKYIFKDCVRDFTHVNDVVECMVEVVETGAPVSGTYEIGTGLGTHVSILFNQFGHDNPEYLETAGDLIEGYQAKMISTGRKLLINDKLPAPITFYTHELTK